MTRAKPAPAESPSPAERALDYARLLVEIGELSEAEGELGAILDRAPELAAARSLLARIKHMRGELSEAFACWAQIEALQPEDGSGQGRLVTMLHLAQDPERGATEFLAVGRSHLWRKPTEMLELEKVFRLFVERRPAQARDAARLLARKYRGADPDLFKLAVLAEAWIAELSGELEEAAEVLERLGGRRGFEDDVDRALALVRVYEQLGAPDHLEKAINVCAFLARTLQGHEQVTALGRLTRLCRALGRNARAARYEERFVAAFQRSMHRVSLAQATAIAAERYVPLPELAAIRFTDRRPPANPTRRQRALVLAAGRRLDEAGALLGGGALLDLHYRADLARMRGARREAVDLYLEALSRDPRSRWVAGWLLAEAADDPAVTAWLAAPDAESEVRSSLEAAIRRSPLRPDLWRQLAALHGIAGRAEEAEFCRQRSAVLETAAARRVSAVGRSRAGAVYRFAGRARGVIHEVWAERRPARPGRGGFLDEVLGAVSPELDSAVRNVFLSVREYARAKLPHLTADLADYTYAYKITKEDQPSHGLSAGLPTALAFLSVFLDRPLPQDLASSGILVADAHDVLVVRAVGDVEAKVCGAYSCALRAILLPAENRAGLEGSPRVPAPVVGELVHFVATLDEAASLVFGPGLWLG